MNEDIIEILVKHIVHEICSVGAESGYYKGTYYKGTHEADWQKSEIVGLQDEADCFIAIYRIPKKKSHKQSD